MTEKFNIIKTSWKLWIAFFILIGLLLILESFFNVRIPDYTYYGLLIIVVCIYLSGYYMVWKNRKGGR